jgi:hypothetical protein
VKRAPVEAVVETLPKVDPKCSYFVEREDDARLILKIWKRGVHQETRRLRATSSPVGSYAVVGKHVVHRYSLDSVMSELAQHQNIVRLRSPAVAVIAKKIAKQVGGTLETWEIDEAGWVAYRVRLRHKQMNDAKCEQLLARINREFAGEAVVAFRAGLHAIGIGIAARDLDLVRLLFSRWDDEIESVVRRVDAECGARLVGLDHDLIQLALVSKPKDPKQLARAIFKMARATEMELDSEAELLDQLATRSLFFWWD